SNLSSAGVTRYSCQNSCGPYEPYVSDQWSGGPSPGRTGWSSRPPPIAGCVTRFVGGVGASGGGSLQPASTIASAIASAIASSIASSIVKGARTLTPDHAGILPNRSVIHAPHTGRRHRIVTRLTEWMAPGQPESGEEKPLDRAEPRDRLE